MKECFSLKRDEEHDQHYGRDPEDQDRKRKKADGKNHFAEMESRRGANVHVQIGVMHVMKSPEDRNHVIGPMPPPVGVIQKQKRGDDSSPSRKREPV